MITELGRIIEHVSNPGDVAIVLVAGTAGFVIDAGLNAVGFLEPGYVGVVVASGSLGIKKGLEAAVSVRAQRNKGKKEASQEILRCRNLISFLRLTDALDGLHECADILESEKELFELDIEHLNGFKDQIEKALRRYRNNRSLHGRRRRIFPLHPPRTQIRSRWRLTRGRLRI